MKKIYVLVFMLGVFVFCPLVVKAEEKSEINVYIFRGEGCIYCENTIDFFKEIESKYGKFYNLVTYEVWNNEENFSLMEKVGEYFGIEARSVPFIIIGKNNYVGYSSELGEKLKEDIIKEYRKFEYDRFDIMENIDTDDLQYEEDKNIMKEKSFFQKIVINIFKIIVDVFDVWLG